VGDKMNVNNKTADFINLLLSPDFDSWMDGPARSLSDAMGYSLKFDGSSDVSNPENGTDYTLEEIQEAVGGLVQIVSTKYNDDKILVVNEEGLIHNLPLNWRATELAGQPIVGNALLTRDGCIK